MLLFWHCEVALFHLFLLQSIILLWRVSGHILPLRQMWLISSRFLKVKTVRAEVIKNARGESIEINVSLIVSLLFSPRLYGALYLATEQYILLQSCKVSLASAVQLWRQFVGQTRRLIGPGFPWVFLMSFSNSRVQFSIPEMWILKPQCAVKCKLLISWGLNRSSTFSRVLNVCYLCMYAFKCPSVGLVLNTDLKNAAKVSVVNCSNWGHVYTFRLKRSMFTLSFQILIGKMVIHFWWLKTILAIYCACAQT